MEAVSENRRDSSHCEAMGRPKKPLTPEESSVIDQAYQRFRYGARMLAQLIWEDYAVIISHNWIHRHLLDRGLAKAETSKRKQRKWVRYERKHSMSAGHINWYEDPVKGLKIWALPDDSSRKIWQSMNLLPSIQRIQ